MGLAEELAFKDACAQAELVRKKDLQPVELVNAAIERIERLNPKLNAVVTPMFDLARASALGKIPEGPFQGVPFLLKDLMAAYAGVPMSLGSGLLREFFPDRDSELVSRLKRAGLIVVGKTNTPEFGILPTTEPRLFGPCHNPWDTARTTGGSSGGSAAAVASGMVPMAHANDGGGSIRIPASCCGVFGLKPTRARNPLGPNFGDVMSGIVCEHAVAQSVRDSAALLDATSGPDLGDPYWAPPPARPFQQEVGAHPGKLRIAFTMEALDGVPVHSDCREAVRSAAKLCEELGHRMMEASPEVDAEQMNRSFLTLWSAGCASTLEGIEAILGRTLKPEDMEPLTWTLYEIGRSQTGAKYLLALQTIQRMARDVARFFLEYDLWLTPTLALPPLPLGRFEPAPDDPLQGLRQASAFAPFTPICNLTGQPAMSVPLFWNGEGLPIGTHFIGRFGDEATLFRLAAQLETARPWIEHHPPVSI
jgi:amidase